jgi:hypothetical protein
MLLSMGRSRHIPKDAKPTTISLTLRQHIEFQELQIRRQKEGRAKPTLTEVMAEGFRGLLKQEGFSDTELEQIFPKQEQPKAKVHVIRKRRKA